MPLVKLFARNTLTKTVPLQRLQAKMCDIWGTQPSTTKLMLFRCEDWTDESFAEDVYVDIRAYGKAERTREFVLQGMKDIQQAFADEGLIANVRLETYQGERCKYACKSKFVVKRRGMRAFLLGEFLKISLPTFRNSQTFMFHLLMKRSKKTCMDLSRGCIQF